MPTLRRDILLMRREINPDPKLIEKEVTSLDQLLRETEATDHYYASFELIDLNRFVIFHDKLHINKAMKRNALKPFQFLVNRN
jgi:recombinational DNA repair protein RecT